MTADQAGFLAAGFGAVCALALAGCFANSFFGAGFTLFAIACFTLSRGAGFFAATVFGSNFFSVSSNAGFGIPFGLIRVVSAAGFTPAAAAARATVAESAAGFGFPSISG